jgi:hypothetical protein
MNVGVLKIMSNKLMGLLSNLRNISISGDTDIKVLIGTTVHNNGESIIMNGLTEWSEQDSFSINLNTIKDIRTNFDDIELLMLDNKIIIISEF